MSRAVVDIRLHAPWPKTRPAFPGLRFRVLWPISGPVARDSQTVKAVGCRVPCDL